MTEPATVAVNRRTWWNHNDHFHGWVVGRLDGVQGPVLDVGCGTGTLVAAVRARGLSPAIGVDPDELMTSTARERLAGDGAVAIHQVSFFDLALGAGPVPAGGVAGITMIASLHHLAHERGLAASLEHARGLLAPGGRLVVVGLARASVPADYAVDAVSVLLNPAVGLYKAAHRRLRPAAVPAGSPADPAHSVMPLRDPDESFTEVVRTAATVLPGARVRRRLWFRYSLEWTAERDGSAPRRAARGRT